MAFQWFVATLLMVAIGVNYVSAQDFYSHWNDMKNQSKCVPADSQFEKDRQAEMAKCLKTILNVDVHDPNFVDKIPEIMNDYDSVRNVVFCIYRERTVLVDDDTTFDMEKNNELLENVAFSHEDDKENLLKARKECYDDYLKDPKEITMCTFLVTVQICGLPIQISMAEGEDNNNNDDVDHTGH
ncbi:hypothetical protein CHUAL_011603 [Chamberlinius hualienensis]